jgi:hypothetical protein
MFNLNNLLSTTSSKEVIEQIHREFYTAGEKLLAEANEILKTKVDTKAERLESLGFRLAKGVREAKEMLLHRKMKKDIADRILYYQGRYPNNKFITHDAVHTICEKYGLVCAPVERFTGFVPEKNLLEVEKFYFHPSDKAQPSVTVKWNNEKGQAKIIKQIRERYPFDEIPKLLIVEGFAKTGYVQFGGSSVRIDSYTEAISDVGMQICAPKKDFDLSGLEKFKNTYKQVVKKDFPDPVVLQPCDGGFLIVTAWGDEASDPLVVNHKMN